MKNVVVVVALLTGSLFVNADEKPCSPEESKKLHAAVKEIAAREHCRTSRNLDCKKILNRMLTPMAAGVTAANLKRPEKPALEWPKDTTIKPPEEATYRLQKFEENKKQVLSQIKWAREDRAKGSTPYYFSFSREDDLKKLENGMEELHQAMKDAERSVRKNGTAPDKVAKIGKVLDKYPIFESLKNYDSVRYAVGDATSLLGDLAVNIKPKHPTLGDLIKQVQDEEEVLQRYKFADDSVAKKSLVEHKAQLFEQQSKMIKYAQDLKLFQTQVAAGPNSFRRLAAESAELSKRIARRPGLTMTRAKWRALKAMGISAGVTAVPIIVESVLEEALLNTITPSNAGDANACGVKPAFADYSAGGPNGVCGTNKNDIGPNVSAYADLPADTAVDLLQNSQLDCEAMRELVAKHSDQAKIDKELRDQIGEIQNSTCAVDGNVEVTYKHGKLTNKHTISYRPRGNDVEITGVHVQRDEGSGLKTLARLTYAQTDSGERLRQLDFVNDAHKTAKVDGETLERVAGGGALSPDMLATALFHHQVAQNYRDEVVCCAKGGGANCFKSKNPGGASSGGDNPSTAPGQK